MKILGIDPGLQSTGIAYLEVNEKIKSTGWEIIKHGGKGSERLTQYFNSLSDIIDREKPELLIIEKTFRGPNTKTLIKLGELRGVYLLLAELKKVPIIEFTPREIKQSVTGSGASSKKQVRYMVKEILKIKENMPLDISDAFGTIICYLNRKDENVRIY